MNTINFVDFRLDTIEKRVFAKFQTTSKTSNSFELEVRRDGLVVPVEHKPIEIDLKRLVMENKHKLKAYCLPKAIKDKWELIEFSMLRGRPSVKVFDRKLEKLKEYQFDDLEMFGDLDSKTKEDLKSLVIHHQDRFLSEVYSHYHSYLDSFKEGYFSTVKTSKNNYRRKTANDIYSR